MEFLVSLVGKATLTEDSKWRTYITQLPTRDEFKAFMADMKETFKSEIAKVRQEIKAISEREELVEEVHEDIRS